MKKVKKLFVSFYSPGSFVANEWTQDVITNNPGAVEWPDNAYAFTLHERVDVIDGDAVFKGDSKQVGPMYYHPDTRVETLAEVRRNPTASEILVRNMECNKWEEIAWSRWGNWPQPFDRSKARVLRA